MQSAFDIRTGLVPSSRCRQRLVEQLLTHYESIYRRHEVNGAVALIIAAQPPAAARKGNASTQQSCVPGIIDETFDDVARLLAASLEVPHCLSSL